MIERMAMTASSLTALISTADGAEINALLQAASDKFRKIGRRIRKGASELEEAVVHSSDVSSLSDSHQLIYEKHTKYFFHFGFINNLNRGGDLK